MYESRIKQTPSFVEHPEELEARFYFDHRKAILLPLNVQGQILIQDRRGYKKPDWGFCGGEIEAGETPVEAIIRESCEELSIQLKPDECTYLGAFAGPSGDGDGLSYIRYVFLLQTNQELFDVREGAGAQWFTPAEARTLLTSNWLNLLFERLKFIG